MLLLALHIEVFFYWSGYGYLRCVLVAGNWDWNCGRWMGGDGGIVLSMELDNE